jgi:hypothetical protein
MSAGPLKPEESDGRWDQGYRMAWHDIHLSTRIRRKRTRRRWPAYAEGYQQGRVDGGSHPYCPEFDETHRQGKLRDLPSHCPWNPATAKLTPGWSPIGETVSDARAIKVTADAIRRRREVLRSAGVAPVLGDQPDRGKARATA